MPRNKNYERLVKTAHYKIPVSEESSLYSLFYKRRKIAKKLIKEPNEYLEQILEDINDLIKDNLLL